MKALVIFSRCVAVLAIIVLAAPFVWGKLTGDYFMTVTGRSMEPTYHLGDVLAVQKPTGDELDKTGNIVVVAFTAGDKDTQYVHRVHEQTPKGTYLKGDGNATADPAPVTQDQVMGTPRFALQGFAASLFHLTQSLGGRLIAGVLALAGVFLNMPTRRERRQSASQDSAELETPAPARTPEASTERISA